MLKYKNIKVEGSNRIDRLCARKKGKTLYRLLLPFPLTFSSHPLYQNLICPVEVPLQVHGRGGIISLDDAGTTIQMNTIAQ